jgi:hypothetical protein
MMDGADSKGASDRAFNPSHASGLLMDKKFTYHADRTNGSCNMNVLSHISRVKPYSNQLSIFGTKLWSFRNDKVVEYI